MLSIVWNRNPEEAYSNPYEYEIQEQFIRECRIVLEELEKIINPDEMRFRVDEYILDKALWMLRSDVIDNKPYLAAWRLLFRLRENRKGINQPKIIPVPLQKANNTPKGTLID